MDLASLPQHLEALSQARLHPVKEPRESFCQMFCIPQAPGEPGPHHVLHGGTKDACQQEFSTVHEEIEEEHRVCR